MSVAPLTTKLAITEYINALGLKRPVVVTMDTQLPVTHIKTNLNTLGIGHDEYLQILKKL